MADDDGGGGSTEGGLTTKEEGEDERSACSHKSQVFYSPSVALFRVGASRMWINNK